VDVLGAVFGQAQEETCSQARVSETALKPERAATYKLTGLPDTVTVHGF
jgi:hypothetical protein